VPEDEFPVESEVVLQQEQLAVWRVPGAMWPLGLGLTFGVVLAREADLPAHLKVVVKQERVAATAPGVEVPLQSEVAAYQERVAVPTASVATQALALVWQVPMALEAEFLVELPVAAWPEEMAAWRNWQVVLKNGLRLILKVALVIEVQLPPGKVVVV